MYATEELTLQYFRDQDKEVTLNELSWQFDFEDMKDLFAIIASLMRKNQIRFVREEVWVITDAGKVDLSKRSAIKKRRWFSRKP